MSDVISVTPNKDGRAVIRLYGQDFDVTNIAGTDGKGSFEAFGETHKFEVFPSKTVAKRVAIMRSESKAKKVDVKTEPKVKDEAKNEA